MRTPSPAHRRSRPWWAAGALAVSMAVFMAQRVAPTVAAAPARPLTVASPGQASGPGTSAAISPGISPAISAEVSAEVARVPVDSAEFRAATTTAAETGAALGATQQARAQADARLVELAARDVELGAVIEAATARRDAAVADFDAARSALRAIAVASYVRGAELDPIEVLLDAERGTEIEGEALLIESVTTDQAGQLDDARARRDDAAGTIDAASLERDAVGAGTRETTAARDGAAADEVRLGAQLVVDLAALEAARALAIVVGADFPLVALDAYHRAAGRLGREQPGCGLPWWALAGIAKVESRHGSFRGTTLAADGSLSRPIIGIPLDGTNGTRAIGDTDGGELDGDTVVDRAVGPMQFIPTTWARWGRDGNDDGREDPQNLYDAALGAGAYLCGAAPLGTDDDLRRAFLRYNVSDAYADEVLRWALGYSSVVIPDA